jgi:hypothetical protein
MVHSGRNVLLAGLDDVLTQRAVNALSPLGLRISRASSLADVVERLGLADVDVVIVAYVGDPSAVAGLHRVDEWSERHGRRPAVILLCPGALLGEAASGLGPGVGRLVILESIDAELCDVVSSILDVAPRFRIRAPVRLVHVTAQEDPVAVGTTENISTSGMLVSCMGEHPVGSTIRFVIAVPGHDLAIRGSARVVRAANPVREGTQGIGAQFESFSGSGRESLNDLLSRQVH